jgi:hypothetical protein
MPQLVVHRGWDVLDLDNAHSMLRAAVGVGRGATIQRLATRKPRALHKVACEPLPRTDPARRSARVVSHATNTGRPFARPVSFCSIAPRYGDSVDAVNSRVLL